MTPEKALDEFSEYCAEVAGDWSDFDGRTLRDEWSKCESVIRPAMVARLRRLEAAERAWEAAREAVLSDVACTRRESYETDADELFEAIGAALAKEEKP
jgi:hypothetical protein